MTKLCVFWDIDGTLIDSESLHQKALEIVCANYNVDISDLNEGHFIGINLNQVWSVLCQRFPSTLSKETWCRVICETYCQGVAELSEMDNAVEVVRALHALGIRQVAVSNSHRVVVDANLSRLGIGSLLDFSISLDDLSRPKPDPFPYQWALERAGIESHQALAVEDSRTGVTSAKAAGLFTLGCGGGMIGAHRDIQSLFEVLDFFHGGVVDGIQN